MYKRQRYLGGLDVFKYIGPGLLVTVGFIDPGNWASNFAAGSEFGYSLDVYKRQDPNSVIYCLKLAALMVKELAGGCLLYTSRCV